ncbi:MAG: sigma-70 family RNA polymerase sigma factor [Desulfamplus sp.]|nr:sigma-70 family RNA polymerase sigma factor [Desulfamplus sp.]
MSDNTELIQLILNRDELNEKDQEKYFNTINGVIKQTAKSLKIKYDTFSIMNVDSIITEDDFLNLCWDIVEGSDDNEHRLIDKLQSKLQDIDFPDDNRLKSYLRKTFERLFLDKIYGIFPDFQTRIKQVSRVMKPLCIKTKGKESSSKGDVWQLKDYDDAVNIPTLAQLKEYTSKIAMPDITYPKSEDGQRGASIKDNDMKNYMVEIFRAAGGVIYKKDIDSLISHLFCMEQISSSKSDISNQSDGDNEKANQEDSFNAPFSTDTVMPPCCYIIMAEQCINTMDEQMKEILYYIYVKELDQGVVAKKIGKSESSVTKIKQKVEKHIGKYIQNDSSEFSYQEGKIIFKLIIELIIEKRQVL